MIKTRFKAGIARDVSGLKRGIQTVEMEFGALLVYKEACVEMVGHRG